MVFEILEPSVDDIDTDTGCCGPDAAGGIELLLLFVVVVVVSPRR